MVPLLGVGINILFKGLQHRLPDRRGPFAQPRLHILTILDDQSVFPRVEPVEKPENDLSFSPPLYEVDRFVHADRFSKENHLFFM